MDLVLTDPNCWLEIREEVRKSEFLSKTSFSKTLDIYNTEVKWVLRKTKKFFYIVIFKNSYKTTFIWSHNLIRLNTFLIRVFGNVMVILMISFQVLRLFCVAYGPCAGRDLILSGSSDLVLHSSINRCVVNGRAGCYGSAFMRYYFIHFIYTN